MVSDSIFTASIPHASKDLGKKKKANRSAKLKQCKLDARREQWLSQVRNKTIKDEGNGIIGGESNKSGDKSANHFKELGIRGQVGEVNYGLLHQETDSESATSTTSPISNVSCGIGPGNSFNGSDSTSSSSSSFGSGVCCSGSFSEEGGDDDDNDDGCLDDWEAVADALAADDKLTEVCSTESVTEKEAVVPANQGILGFGVDKPNLEDVAQGCRAAVNTKAWRADDAFRPQSLPSLMKQKSFPMNSEKHCGNGINPWGFSQAPSPVPTACPICYEDLDFTDSSFLPCLCGFRLCLFCHKKILEGDGRCPGCRKAYELEAVSEGTPIVRLARSCSMFSRA